MSVRIHLCCGPGHDYILRSKTIGACERNRKLRDRPRCRRLIVYRKFCVTGNAMLARKPRVRCCNRESVSAKTWLKPSCIHASTRAAFSAISRSEWYSLRCGASIG